MLLAILASALILFGSPYVGQVRSALRSAFPEEYPWIIGGVTVTAVVAAIAWAVVRLRQSESNSGADASTHRARWVRYMLVVVAVVVSAVYARVVSSGDSEVDLVEAFHFVEYGTVAYLFYRVWCQRADLSAIAFPACAGVGLGILDEWVQWFVPGRVGELHDVLLNAVAVGCGLLFSVVVHPPRSLAWPTPRSTRLALGAAASALLLTFAGFVDAVHLGYEIPDGTGGLFRSRYDAKALTMAASDRPGLWKVSPPPARGFRHEDHYLSEGEWHIQRRNIAFGKREWFVALREDAVLERFYSPVLDVRGRWSQEQRSEVERHVHGPEPTFVSDAAPYPIYVVNHEVFWTFSLALTAAVAWLATRR